VHKPDSAPFMDVLSANQAHKGVPDGCVALPCPAAGRGGRTTCRPAISQPATGTAPNSAHTAGRWPMPDTGRSSKSGLQGRMPARSLSWIACLGAYSRVTSWSCRRSTAWPGLCPTWSARYGALRLQVPACAAKALDAGTSPKASPNGLHDEAAAALSRPNLQDGHGLPERVEVGHAATPPPIRRRRGGRPPKLSAKQQGAVLDEVLSGLHTAADMARRYKVSEAAISRLLAAYRAESSATAACGQVGTDPAVPGRIAGVLPVSALGERLAIVGTSGSGKTYAAKGLLERLVNQGARVYVVDPLGVCWGLRAGADGGTSPLPFPVALFGGRAARRGHGPGPRQPSRHALGGLRGGRVQPRQQCQSAEVHDGVRGGAL